MKLLLSVVFALSVALAMAKAASAYPACQGTVAGVSGSTITGSHPSCAATGMVELALVYVHNSQPTISTPSGWNVIDGPTTLSTADVAETYWHCYASGDPAPAWSLTGFAPGTASVVISAYSDNNCSSPIDKHNLAAANSAASLTPTSANEDQVMMASFGTVGGFTNPTGSLIPVDRPSVAATNLNVTYLATAGTAATGSETLLSSGSGFSAMVLLSPPTSGHVFSGIRATTVGTTGSSSVNCAVPANIQANDSVWAFVEWNQSGTVTPPSGFSSVLTRTGINCFSLAHRAYCKTASGSETGNFTFSTTASQISCTVIDTFGASCTPDAQADTLDNTGHSSVTTPTVTTTAANEAILSGMASCSTTGNPVSPQFPLSHFIGTNMNMGDAFYQQQSAGVTTGQVFSLGSVADNDTMTFALPNTQPTPTPAPTPGADAVMIWRARGGY